MPPKEGDVYAKIIDDSRNRIGKMVAVVKVIKIFRDPLGIIYDCIYLDPVALFPGLTSTDPQRSPSWEYGWVEFGSLEELAAVYDANGFIKLYPQPPITE